MTELRPQVLILGGGIAGLWLLARLRSAGYGVLLVETTALGGIQTLASQGIIHGGIKYALTGHLTGAAQAIAAMPARWRACLEGRGELDLRRARLLASHQYLWSSGGVASELAGLFASRVMRGRVTAVEGAERPALFRHGDFHGHVYRLDEPVLDPASLSAALAALAGDACLAAGHIELLEGRTLALTGPDGARALVRPQRLVLAAGAGNGDLLAGLGRSRPAQQLRPLRMLMARGDLPELYAHCLGAGATPRLTVTSQPLASGERVWYLGGQVAEAGVRRSPDQQLAAGRQELANLLPWLEQGGLRWASLSIDRAEPRQPGGLRPDQPMVDEAEGVLVTWPVKLAFAPLVADQVLERLAGAGIQPAGAALERPGGWPAPPLGRLPWEQVAEWS